jgi:hypothetical protein
MARRPSISEQIGLRHAAAIFVPHSGRITGGRYSG